MVKHSAPVLVIIQARMNSDRLPGKVMLPLAGKPAIKHIWDRLNKFPCIIATGSRAYNSQLMDYCEANNMQYFEGSDENVLQRFQLIADIWRPDTIIRITGDCPLVDVELINDMLTYYYSNDYYYVSNVKPATYPDGYDIEIFDRNAIYIKELTDKEHVTLNMSGGNCESKVNLNNYRLTLDYADDYEILKFIFENCEDTSNHKSVVKFIESNPAVKQAVLKNFERWGRNEI